MILHKKVSTGTGVAIIVIAAVVIFGSLFGMTYYADLYAASILNSIATVNIK